MTQVGDRWYRFYVTNPYGTPWVDIEYRYVQEITECGVWLNWMKPYKRGDGTIQIDMFDAKWQAFNSGAGKYKPTLEEAWESFRIRSNRRVRYAERELKAAHWAVHAAIGPMPVPLITANT